MSGPEEDDVDDETDSHTTLAVADVDDVVQVLGDVAKAFLR